MRQVFQWRVGRKSGERGFVRTGHIRVKFSRVSEVCQIIANNPKCPVPHYGIVGRNEFMVGTTSYEFMLVHCLQRGRTDACRMEFFFSNKLDEVKQALGRIVGIYMCP